MDGEGRRPTTPHNAAGGATGIAPGVERIAGGAPDRVARVGTGTQVGHVGLGGDDRASPAQPRHQVDVGLRHVVSPRDVAVGGQQASGVLQVLSAQRKAVQQRQRLAAHHLGFGHACGVGRALEVGGCKRVHARVQRFHAGDAGVHQSDRRERTPAHQTALFDGTEANNVFGLHGPAPGSGYTLRAQGASVQRAVTARR